ncbi:hypothetical protein TREES_T100004166 [Tupaia chinensis]|uniref:Uncharacterized protein n=1 Tax=Tupaia chinensis TaxID=246437 RepID=L9KH32_TUPCH|nr:hypothetical protein TREES_T100004166 [Tupaia chinensis]
MPLCDSSPDLTGYGKASEILILSAAQVLGLSGHEGAFPPPVFISLFPLQGNLFPSVLSGLASSFVRTELRYPFLAETSLTPPTHHSIPHCHLPLVLATLTPPIFLHTMSAEACMVPGSVQ